MTDCFLFIQIQEITNLLFNKNLAHSKQKGQDLFLKPEIWIIGLLKFHLFADYLISTGKHSYLGINHLHSN